MLGMQSIQLDNRSRASTSTNSLESYSFSSHTYDQSNSNSSTISKNSTTQNNTSNTFSVNNSNCTALTNGDIVHDSSHFWCSWFISHSNSSSQREWCLNREWSLAITWYDMIWYAKRVSTTRTNKHAIGWNCTPWGIFYSFIENVSYPYPNRVYCAITPRYDSHCHHDHIEQYSQCHSQWMSWVELVLLYLNPHVHTKPFRKLVSIDFTWSLKILILMIEIQLNWVWCNRSNVYG